MASDVCVTCDTCDNTAVAHDVMTHCVMCHDPLPGHTEWEDTGSYPEISAIWEHQGREILRPVHFEANNQPGKIFAWEIRI